MEVLLELLIIEIIFLQSKFTQSFWTNVEIFSILLNSYVYFSKVYSCQVLGGGMVQTAFLLSRRCSLATPAFSAFLLRCQPWPRQLFLFKTKLIICGRVAGIVGKKWEPRNPVPGPFSAKIRKVNQNSESRREFGKYSKIRKAHPENSEKIRKVEQNSESSSGKFGKLILKIRKNSES